MQFCYTHLFLYEVVWFGRVASTVRRVIEMGTSMQRVVVRSVATPWNPTMVVFSVEL